MSLNNTKRLFLLLLTAALLTAHGVQQHLLQGGYGIRISYDDGSPMDFADVLLFRPDNDQLEFQSAATDERGVFMFLPDTTGTWTVKVSDGLGHGAVIPVTVGKIQETTPANAERSRSQKLVSGTGYILFIFSAWYVIVRRKQERHAHS